MVAGGWVLSEGVMVPAVTGPGFLILIKIGVTPGFRDIDFKGKLI
jgi:hypothetical protein